MKPPLQFFFLPYSMLGWTSHAGHPLQDCSDQSNADAAGLSCFCEVHFLCTGRCLTRSSAADLSRHLLHPPSASLPFPFIPLAVSMVARIPHTKFATTRVGLFRCARSRLQWRAPCYLLLPSLYTHADFSQGPAPQDCRDLLFILT